MNRPESRRRSSVSSKKCQSTERKSLTDSFTEDDVLHRDFSSNPLLEEKPKINYQDELVLVFFNSMLDTIIDEWVTVPDEPPQVCFCIEEKIKSSSLTKNDLPNVNAANGQSSKLSLAEKLTKRRISAASKDSGKSKDIGSQDLIKRKRSKSGDRVRSPGRESFEQRSKTSVKRRSKDSSKSDSRKSRRSSHDSSLHQTSLNWILDPPDENVIIRFKNGNRYEGPVSKKLMHGYGKFIWGDGTVYEGDFVHGYATGHGMLQYTDLSFYHGTFCKSLLHGEGVFNMNSTPMIYTGHWKASQKHGQGWVLYEGDNWYEGEWYEDKRQGMGYRQYKNGARYKGLWYQGNQHGEGTMVWSNNDLYKGKWKYGMMNGYGEYIWNAFLNDTLTFPIENVYQGNWVDGKRDGIGIMNFGTANGAQLAGTWSNNMKHGPGVLVCGNGKLLERNPLFWNDKPIHLNIEADPGYPVLYLPQESKATPTAQNTNTNENKSTLHLIVEQIRSKCENREIGMDILKKIESTQPKIQHAQVEEANFLSGKTLCSPLSIPMHLAAEQTDFSHYITLAVQTYIMELYKWELSCDTSENSSGGVRTDPSWVSKYSKWNIMSHLTNLSRSFKSSPGRILQSPSDVQLKFTNLYASQAQTEEKHLRHTIIVHLENLHKFYHKYATITSPHSVDFKPILIRYFLWQMLRDLKIPSRKHSLVDIDTILIENPASGLDSKHYPFEKIYFWQFLQILLTLSWLLHSPKDITADCKNFGILSAIFKKFLQNFVYKNVEFTYACSLFEYRDLLPLNSAYVLYQNLGEPHTARKFLNSVCTRKREHPPCYLKIFKDEKTPKLARGVNAVPVGGNIIYLPDDPPDIGEKPPEPDPEPPTDDPFRRELFVLRSLGPKKVVECLTAVSPHIVQDGVIVNMDYPLTFIEFYDAFLLCGFTVVDQMSKQEEKIMIREQKRAHLEAERSKSISSYKGGKAKEKSTKGKK